MIRRRAVLSLLIVAGGLALPEAGARLAHRLRRGVWPLSMAETVARSKVQIGALFEEHTILPFVLRPGARTRFMDTVATVNSVGLRGSEVRADAPLRVLVVGGSTVFDTGVTDDTTTWCHRLEEALSGPLPGTQVLNGGVPVYQTWANYLKFVLYDRYMKPDVVLVYQGANDALPWWPRAQEALLRRDYWLYRGAVSRAWSGVQGQQRLALDPPVGLLDHSVFLRGAYNDRGRNENVFADMVWAGTVDEAMPDAHLAKNLDVFRDFLRAIRAEGAVPIFVPQTVGHAGRPKLAPTKLQLWSPALDKLNAVYVREAVAMGVTVIDTTGVTRMWDDEYFTDLAHFNDRGAASLAALVGPPLARDPAVRGHYRARPAS